MIERLIHWSVRHRPLVFLVTLLIAIAGIQALQRTPLDAVPDLSDVQVILRASLMGQTPQAIEDQVSYPLASAMLGVSGARAVRAWSLAGESYIYVIFDEDADGGAARSRVLEALAEVRDRLPEGLRVTLGPDASGVGWVYQYALVDRSGRHDLGRLRDLQDWFLRYELASLPGVAEAASVGGMVRAYEVALDPARWGQRGVDFMMLRDVLRDASREVSGSVIELAEAEYMVRARRAVNGIEDLRRLPVSGMSAMVAVPRLGEIAEVREAPLMRRGIAELDGEGEVAGGIVVMQRGENALDTIDRVRARLAELKPSLPEGVEIVEVYDRSAFILRAVRTLFERLGEEFVAVVLVCAAFLLHLRSSLVVVLSLPVGVLAAFLVMSAQGITANLMSLGGIAIAIGAMVDAAIVMIENVHKRREVAGGVLDAQGLAGAVAEVGRPLFFSLLIIAVSFLPILALEQQEGRLFAPLAWTKTWAMAAATILSVTLVPALIAVLVKGRVRGEAENPLNRMLMAVYRPLLGMVLRHPARTVAVSLLLVASTLWPWSRLGSEFMPEMDEGDLLYMPTALPGLSAAKASELLQQTDRMIRTVPEVARVFGKAGAAETATDPAPLTMFETTIQLRPREEWRDGMTLDGIRAELDAAVRVPGLTNTWLGPIAARIDMLATGIKTPVGIKISGPDLMTLQGLGERLEAVLGAVPGTRSVLAERPGNARYIDVEIDPDRAAQRGVSLAELHETVEMAIGGQVVAWSVEGRERHPIVLRYDRDLRDSLPALSQVAINTVRAPVPLGDVANLVIRDGPEMIRSEDGRLSVWVYVDPGERDPGSWVREARERVVGAVALPPGYSLAWSGRHESLERVRERLGFIVPMTLGVILVLLYLNFRNLTEPLLVMVALPLALVGGFWLLWALDHRVSTASAVGFIALAGVAAEFGVVMLVYLDQAVKRHQPQDEAGLRTAVIEGALLRLRPKAMTALVILAGLLPILIGGGAGSEVMSRIAAPMVGGMVTAPLVSLLLLPALYLIWKRRGLVAERASPAGVKNPDNPG